MIAIDARPGSPFAGWWHGVAGDVQRLAPLWNNLVLAELILKAGSDIPFDVLYQVIEESTSHRVQDWLDEARKRAGI